MKNALLLDLWSKAMMDNWHELRSDRSDARLYRHKTDSALRVWRYVAKDKTGREWLAVQAERESGLTSNDFKRIMHAFIPRGFALWVHCGDARNGPFPGADRAAMFACLEKESPVPLEIVERSRDADPQTVGEREAEREKDRRGPARFVDIREVRLAKGGA